MFPGPTIAEHQNATQALIDRGHQKRQLRLVLSDDGGEWKSYRHIMPSWLGPRAGDEVGRTPVKQFKSDGAAELTWPIRGARTRHLDEVVAGLIENRCGQRHLRAVDRRITGNR